MNSSRYSHHPRRFFGPLDPILVRAMTIRRRDVSLPSSSAITLTSPRPHGLTIVEPRVATTRYLG
jgi:hypothetical protein